MDWPRRLRRLTISVGPVRESIGSGGARCTCLVQIIRRREPATARPTFDGSRAVPGFFLSWRIYPMLPFHAPVEHPPPDKPPVHSPHHLPPRGSRSCMLQATPSTIPCPPWTPDRAAATTPTHTHHRTGNSSPILNIPISGSPSHTIPVLPHLFHLRSPHPPSATTTPRSSTFPTRLSPTATRTNGLCNPPINVSPPSFFRPSESLIEFLIAAQQIPAPYVDRGESLFPIQYTRACSEDCI